MTAALQLQGMDYLPRDPSECTRYEDLGWSTTVRIWYDEQVEGVQEKWAEVRALVEQQRGCMVVFQLTDDEEQGERGGVMSALSTSSCE